MTVYTVIAPLEGDGLEDAVTWYFRSREEAENFAREGYDHEMTNPHEGPYEVAEREFSREQCEGIEFTEYP